MCYDRKIMYKILLTLFVLLISFTSAKADDCRGDRPQYDEDGTFTVAMQDIFRRVSITKKTLDDSSNFKFYTINISVKSASHQV